MFTIYWFNRAKMETSLPELLNNIKQWYNGYSFGGNITLYNPYSLLLFFHKQRFGNYWFETGTPTFLVEIIQHSPGLRPLNKHAIL